MRQWGIIMIAAAGLFGGLVESGFAQGSWPTPEITEIVKLDVSGGEAYAMRAELGGTGTFVGLAVSCVDRADEESAVSVFFGGFPQDRRSVQLAVKGVDGLVERFGPVVSGGPESGFHSPRIMDRVDMLRFVNVALRAGALVSNGHRSFWNKVPDKRNVEIREWFLSCSDSGAKLESGGLKRPERLGLEKLFVDGILDVFSKRLFKRIIR